ncbi:hypothetical protein [Pseudonocardia asaccharolytica]|uniref:Uncharacterized protein n=1 Tax=Pseudonocardia asaccharolytica DSM 44247 = NBRC 16224 TaxID=1123024 RepID=A0A511D5V5_9PSEU|nr:hypothetical protein [Pseudonocardia asaccharolytica]GEL20172.1 hypothetical protein PA7_40090 [Pseudonocardia asaccharolytica DSM 44247 = NBRC 16224]
MTVPQGRPRPPHDAPGTRPSGPSGAPPLDAVRASIAAAMAGLDELEDRPYAEHVAAFETVHAALGDALAAGTAPGQVPGRA